MTELVRLKEDLLILLDVDRLFGGEEIEAVTGAAIGAGAWARPSGRLRPPYCPRRPPACGGVLDESHQLLAQLNADLPPPDRRA